MSSGGIDGLNQNMQSLSDFLSEKTEAEQKADHYANAQPNNLNGHGATEIGSDVLADRDVNDLLNRDGQYDSDEMPASQERELAKSQQSPAVNAAKKTSKTAAKVKLDSAGPSSSGSADAGKSGALDGKDVTDLGQIFQSIANPTSAGDSARFENILRQSAKKLKKESLQELKYTNIKYVISLLVVATTVSIMIGILASKASVNPYSSYLPLSLALMGGLFGWGSMSIRRKGQYREIYGVPVQLKSWGFDKNKKAIPDDPKYWIPGPLKKYFPIYTKESTTYGGGEGSLGQIQQDYQDMLLKKPKEAQKYREWINDMISDRYTQGNEKPDLEPLDMPFDLTFYRIYKEMQKVSNDNTLSLSDKGDEYRDYVEELNEHLEKYGFNPKTKDWEKEWGSHEIYGWGDDFVKGRSRMRDIEDRLGALEANAAKAERDSKRSAAKPKGGPEVEADNKRKAAGGPNPPQQQRVRSRSTGDADDIARRRLDALNGNPPLQDLLRPPGAGQEPIDPNILGSQNEYFPPPPPNTQAPGQQPKGKSGQSSSDSSALG